MSQTMDEYAQWLSDLEKRLKSVREKLKEYQSLKNIEADLELDISKIKSKMSLANGPNSELFNPSDLEQKKQFSEESKNDFSGMTVNEAANKYLSNNPQDRTMKGIVEALNDGGKECKYNNVQSVLNRLRGRGSYIKKRKKWYVPENNVQSEN